ncbi:MAG TPA: lysophospholipase [Kofleriaceae bacterium]|nr:lysophospholipase [Kofleriaceae bacterium]
MVASAAPPPAAPGPIEPTASFTFHSTDGTELYGEFFAAPSPRGAALIIHGYAEHCGRYREVAHVLREAGMSSLAFDLRGHGRAHGPRGHVLRFGEYLEDVKAALAELDARASRDLPLALVCHSHGSLIGLRLLADPWGCPKRVRCAVLSSPFLRLRAKVSPVKRAAARGLGWLLPSFSLPNEIDIEKLTHDAGKLAERRVDTLCHDVAGARWYNEALAAQAWVREFAHRVAVPTLWLVAADDVLVDPEASREVHARIDKARADWHLFEGLYHEVMNETDRAVAFALVRSFLDENFP